MKVNKIDSTIITPKTTGYSAAGFLSAALLSGISKNKTVRKAHKPAAWLAAFLSLLHIAQIEYYHYKFKLNK